MFDNLPDNVSHADFNEPKSSQFIEYVNDLLPEWLKDFAEDKVTNTIMDSYHNQIDPESTVERVKEAVGDELVDHYMEHFDKLFADYMSDYIPDRYRVEYNRFTDKLELHLIYTPDGDYFMASVACFKDWDGNSDDHHYVSIHGKSGEVRLSETETFEHDIIGDLEQDALHFSSKLMQIVERAESYYNKL